MSPPPTSLELLESADLKRLREEGYEVSIRGAHLLVEVPYVNAERKVRRGTLVSDLTLAGNRTTRPHNHVVHFIGDHPCHRDGSPIRQIEHSASRQDLGHGLLVDRSFSNKPPDGFPDYHAKMSSYANIIAGPAESLDPAATARTFRVTPSEDGDSVFQYVDTASTRAGISAASERFGGLRIAIIGLGGTGSYVLDLVAKCPVAEIHLYDGDKLGQHNAFRSPGAPSMDDLREQPFKVDHFTEVYTRMHRRIMPHAYFVDASNVAEFAGFDFVFLCVDKGSAKVPIVRCLEENGRSFIDVGMGVYVDDAYRLRGIVRATASSPAKRDHFRARVSLADTEGGEYARNIQIADLNSLNAALAVMLWKKLVGFYGDEGGGYSLTYTIDAGSLASEDPP